MPSSNLVGAIGLFKGVNSFRSRGGEGGGAAKYCISPTHQGFKGENGASAQPPHPQHSGSTPLGLAFLTVNVAGELCVGQTKIHFQPTRKEWKQR